MNASKTWDAKVKCEKVDPSITRHRWAGWLAAACLYLGAAQVPAALVSVDWDNADLNPDGMITGTLGGISVSMQNGTLMSNPTGGQYLATDWSVNLGSNDIVGIGDPGVLAEAATMDMGGAGIGTTTISFGQAITNPILLFNFVDDSYHGLNFTEFMPEPIFLDQNLVNPNVSLGNLLNVPVGDGNNTADSGFAIQLTGSFSSISFDTSGLDFLTPQSLGFTVVATPEPSSALLVLGGLVSLAVRRRRK